MKHETMPRQRGHSLTHLLTASPPHRRPGGWEQATCDPPSSTTKAAKGLLGNTVPGDYHCGLKWTYTVQNATEVSVWRCYVLVIAIVAHTGRLLYCTRTLAVVAGRCPCLRPRPCPCLRLLNGAAFAAHGPRDRTQPLAAAPRPWPLAPPPSL